MVEYLREGQKAAFRLHQQKGRERAPLVSVSDATKKHGKLSSKVVGPSASLHFIFCSLVQNSDPGARNADLFTPKGNEKEKTKTIIKE